MYRTVEIFSKSRDHIQFLLSDRCTEMHNSQTNAS